MNDTENKNGPKISECEVSFTVNKMINVKSSTRDQVYAEVLKQVVIKMQYMTLGKFYFCPHTKEINFYIL